MIGLINGTHEYQGGIEDEVYGSKIFQDYINSPVVAGYIGSTERTIERDKIVIKALRETGLGKHGIAVWLTSGDARHMMDDVDEETSNREFWKIVRRHTKNAFVKVTIWSHPDHSGFLRSTNEIYDKIKKEFCNG